MARRPNVPGGMTHERFRPRGDIERETTALTVWLVSALAGVFVIQFALELASGGGKGGLAEGLALSAGALRNGRWWTLGTFWFVHSTANLFHVGVVIAGLVVLGRGLRDRLAPGAMLGVFGLGLLGGALWWMAANWTRSGELIGATAGVYALLVLAARISPEREMRFLLLFFFPVTLRLRHLLWGLLALDGAAFALTDLFGQPLPFDYAASSHLGGMAAGWIAGRRLAPPAAPEIPLPAEAFSLVAGATTPAPRTAAQLRAEVDRVLDKISARGLGALTPDERRTLDEAKHQLNRR